MTSNGMKVIDIKYRLFDIADTLRSSKTKVSVSCKLEVAEIVLHLMATKKHFGLFVILGWQDKWNSFTDISDSNQDIFQKHDINISDYESSYKDIASTVNFDGAILIGSKGNIMHSGINIEGLRPKVIADKINPGKFKDLSEQFGFKEKVHTRHLAAIASSYTFKGTTVFTVSEESDAFHIYEEGKIIYESR
jgi:DNA integrity scanning protein DisA with diadenylate cyclase activity